MSAERIFNSPEGSGELIVYASIRSPSVVCRPSSSVAVNIFKRLLSKAVRPILFILHIYSIYTWWERIIVFLFRSDKNSGYYGDL